MKIGYDLSTKLRNPRPIMMAARGKPEEENKHNLSLCDREERESCLLVCLARAGHAVEGKGETGKGQQQQLAAAGFPSFLPLHAITTSYFREFGWHLMIA